MNTPLELFEVDGKQCISVPEEYRNKISTFGLQYLQPHGFFNEVPSNAEGYTPWYTYPAIEFLNDIIKPEHKVLEYGSGYSTLYFKNKVQELCTIEHDLDWAKKIVAMNDNLEIKVCVEQCKVIPEAISRVVEFLQNFKQILSRDRQHDITHGLINNDFAGYASMIYNYPLGHFDIVVIDGMARALCGYLAVERIAEDGYIILDNSDRWQYNHLQEYLVEQGFGRIDFWGPGHGVYEKWCTSFFSRKFKVIPNNVCRPVDQRPILR